MNILNTQTHPCSLRSTIQFRAFVRLKYRKDSKINAELVKRQPSCNYFSDSNGGPFRLIDALIAIQYYRTIHEHAKWARVIYTHAGLCYVQLAIGDSRTGVRCGYIHKAYEIHLILVASLSCL